MATPTRKQLQSAIKIQQQYQARATRGQKGAGRQLVVWNEILDGMIEELRKAADDGDEQAERLLKIYGL